MNDLPLSAPPASGQGSNLPEYTVSELSLALKRSIEDGFGQVRGEGEISGFKRPGSGHCYFGAQGCRCVLDAVCWRTTAIRLDLKPETGWRWCAAGASPPIPAARNTAHRRHDRADRHRRVVGVVGGAAAAPSRPRVSSPPSARRKPRRICPEVIGIVTLAPRRGHSRYPLHRSPTRFPRAMC